MVPEFNPSLGPLTHTIHYAGTRFRTTHEQAAGIAKAMAEARIGTHAFIGVPATDIDTGHTVGRYLLIGPGIPVLVEGPIIPEVGM